MSWNGRIEVVTGDADEVERNLHPTVSLLRSALAGGAFRPRGGFVLSRKRQYRLDPAIRWEVDVDVFRRQAEAGERARREGRFEVAVDYYETTVSGGIEL